MSSNIVGKASILFILSLAIGNVAVADCGLHFDVPKGWNVQVWRPEEGGCAMGVSPANWSELVQKARWPDSENAIEITVLEGDMDDVAQRVELEHDDEGNWALPSRGVAEPLQKTRYGGMPAWEASAWNRGFAKEGAKLHGESRVFTNTYTTVLIQRGPRSWIFVHWENGNPDIKVDRDAAAKTILRSVRNE